MSLHALDRRDDALGALSRAVEIDPTLDEAHYYLGLLHQRLGQLDVAIANFKRTIELNPVDPDAAAALGGVLMQLRRPEEAEQAFARALAINPGNDVARAHWLYLLAVDCDWDRLRAERHNIPELGVMGGSVPPLNLLAFEDHPARHRIRSERFAAANFGSIVPLPARERPKVRPERLRIGYFSADFRDHATMFLAARMFELHDRAQFTVHAYSYGRDDGGVMRKRARDAFDEFNDVRALSDLEVAKLARRDGIDIAVDLKGYRAPTAGDFRASPRAGSGQLPWLPRNTWLPIH